MKITTILDILKSYGASDRMIENCKKNDMPKLVRAAGGRSESFCIKTDELGSCYRGYSVVVVNYGGSQDEWPMGMCGPVPPKGKQDHGGISVANFYYDIDSSG